MNYEQAEKEVFKCRLSLNKIALAINAQQDRVKTAKEQELFNLLYEIVDSLFEVSRKMGNLKHE